MQFKFTVRGDRITRENENSFVEGNQNSYKAVFDFGDEEIWKNVARLCIIECDNGDVYRLPVIDGGCTLPALDRGKFKIGVMGVLTYDGDVIEGEEGLVISTNMHRCEVEDGAASKEANAELNNAAQIWMRYLSDMEENRAMAEDAAERAKDSEKAAEESAKSVLKIAEMTVSAEELPEGEPATVTKTEDEETLHLTFRIPKGERGPKGDKGDAGEKGDRGDDGKTPVKGVDYFTPDDIEEFNNSPKDIIKFSNGYKLIAREDGVYCGSGEGVEKFLGENGIFANESMFSWVAECDVNGDSIHETYATKEDFRSHLYDDFMSVLDRLDSVEQSVETLALVTDEETTPFATKEEVGNINTALESIIAMQNSLIGGGSV